MVTEKPSKARQTASKARKMARIGQRIGHALQARQGPEKRARGAVRSAQPGHPPMGAVQAGIGRTAHSVSATQI